MTARANLRRDPTFGSSHDSISWEAQLFLSDPHTNCLSLVHGEALFSPSILFVHDILGAKIPLPSRPAPTLATTSSLPPVPVTASTMENMRGVTAGSGRQSAQQESPEQLLDVFKAAALSVTKLYKTSAAAQSKARADGYQDCLYDILAFLDKETTGTGDGDGSKIRRWVRERLDGRESSSPNTESEDEIDKAETSSSPELTRPNTVAQQMSQMRTDSAPPSIPPTATVEEQTPLVVPSQDNFTFQAAHPYPNIATLNLSDSRPHDGSSMTATRPSKTRLNNPGRACPRGPGHLAQRAGAKRKLNFEEIFDLGSLGGKDPFGNGGGKRGRHA